MLEFLLQMQAICSKKSNKLHQNKQQEVFSTNHKLIYSVKRFKETNQSKVSKLKQPIHSLKNRNQVNLKVKTSLPKIFKTVHCLLKCLRNKVKADNNKQTCSKPNCKPKRHKIKILSLQISHQSHTIHLQHQ